MSARTPVNLCPYCGEEDLRPVETETVAAVEARSSAAGVSAPGGAWHCRSCLRVFSVAYHGTVRERLRGPVAR